MNFSCNTKLLLEKISIVIKAISPRTTQPILECILIDAKEDGFLRLVSNNLEMCIEVNNVEAEVTEAGTVALDAKMFMSIVQKLPGDTVSIITDFNNVATISSKKAEFRILGLPGEEFPIPPNIEKDVSININANDFKNSIRNTIFAVAVDESKPVLTGELLEIEDGFLNIVAVDGFRVAYSRLKLMDEINNTSLVVPGKTLLEITKIIPTDYDGEISMFMTDRHVLFEIESCVIISRVLEGDFIKYQQVFSDDCTTAITVNHDELLSSLERASLIASKEIKKSPVKLQISDDNITISSNTEIGTVKDEVDITLDGNTLEINFNPRYLIEILKAIEEDNVVMQFTTSLSPCVIKGQESDNSKFLVLPLRLNS